LRGHECGDAHAQASPLSAALSEADEEIMMEFAA
jgi:hypothetical protein